MAEKYAGAGPTTLLYFSRLSARLDQYEKDLSAVATALVCFSRPAERGAPRRRPTTARMATRGRRSRCPAARTRGTGCWRRERVPRARSRRPAACAPIAQQQATVL